MNSIYKEGYEWGVRDGLSGTKNWRARLPQIGNDPFSSDDIIVFRDAYMDGYDYGDRAYEQGKKNFLSSRDLS